MAVGASATSGTKAGKHKDHLNNPHGKQLMIRGNIIRECTVNNIAYVIEINRK